MPDKDLNLTKTTIKKTIKKTDEGISITLVSPNYCRSVMVDIEGVATPFSDNYFDLLPNIQKVITLKTNIDIKQDDIKVKSLADIPVNKDKLKAKMFRIKFALKPLNIGNWFWYSVN